MKAFIPVLIYAAITFLMLAGWIEFSGASPDLRPLLYLARAIAWAVGIVTAAVLFLPRIASRRMTALSAVAAGVTAVLIHYALFGVLTAYAEERVIQNRRAHPDPHDDMGPTYLYAEFSGSGYSRGAAEVAVKTRDSLIFAVVSGLLWFSIIYFGSRQLYPGPTCPTENRQT